MRLEKMAIFHLIFFLSFDRLNLPTDIFTGGSKGCHLLNNLIDMLQRYCYRPARIQ